MPLVASQRAIDLQVIDPRPDDNFIRYFIDGTAQAIVLLFDLENTPVTPINISFYSIFKETGRKQYGILSGLNPATVYTVTLETATSIVVPLPLPLQTVEIIARISGMDMDLDTLNLDFLAERGLTSPSGTRLNAAFGVPRGHG